MKSRDTLRKEKRALRRALTPQDQQHAALNLASNLAQLDIFRRSRHIALYLPNDGEIDLKPVMNMAWNQKKFCYLPVLRGNSDKRLWFARYEPDTKLSANRFMIPEPCVPSYQLVHAWSLDLLLMPLVAFDADGNRLGMGGGYYDRTLAYLASRKVWKKPRLVGVAHELQSCPRLERQPWDVPLDTIVTDKQLYRIKPA